MPEHYFSVWFFEKFWEITKNKPIFSQYNVFYNYEYFFFQSAFWSLFNHRQRSQSNQEQCSMCCSLFSCFAVHSLRVVAMLFNIISKIKRNRSFTAPISRLCYFLRLCYNSITSKIRSLKQFLYNIEHKSSDIINLEHKSLAAFFIS